MQSFDRNLTVLVIINQKWLRSNFHEGKIYLLSRMPLLDGVWTVPLEGVWTVPLEGSRFFCWFDTAKQIINKIFFFKSAEGVWVFKSCYLSWRGSCLTAACVSEPRCSPSLLALHLLCLLFLLGGRQQWLPVSPVKLLAAAALWHTATSGGQMWTLTHASILFAYSLELDTRSWVLFFTFKKASLQALGTCVKNVFAMVRYSISPVSAAEKKKSREEAIGKWQNSLCLVNMQG